MVTCGNPPPPHTHTHTHGLLGSPGGFSDVPSEGHINTPGGLLGLQMGTRMKVFLFLYFFQLFRLLLACWSRWRLSYCVLWMCWLADRGGAGQRTGPLSEEGLLTPDLAG